MKAFLGIIVVFVIMGLSTCGYVVSTNNQAVQIEEAIKAQKTNSLNVLARTSSTIMEIAQVTDMYTDDLKAIIDAEVQGKYGEGGSQAMFQWFKDREINLPVEMYTKIQDTSKAGRKDFEVQQTMLTDKIATYETWRKEFPRSYILEFLGFPKINLEKLSQLILNDYTDNAEATKKAEPIKLR